jgi:hypothetical protein
MSFRRSNVTAKPHATRDHLTHPAPPAPVHQPVPGCSRLPSLATWRSALFTGGHFPWLRDLEERVPENLYGAEGGWYWELLVRQLGILRKEGRSWG